MDHICNTYFKWLINISLFSKDIFLEMSKIIFDSVKDGSTETEINERASLLFGEKKIPHRKEDKS